MPRFLIILCLIALSGSLSAQNYRLDRHGADILTEWRFAPDDRPEYAGPDFDYSDWRSLNPWTSDPSAPEISWFRARFDLSDGGVGRAPLGLLVPARGGSVEIYLNGTLIRAQSPPGGPINSWPELIMLEEERLKATDNVLALRGPAFASHSYHDYIYIGNFWELQKRLIYDVLWTALLAFVEIFLGIYYFIIYLQRRKESYYLYFALVSFSLGVWLLAYEGYTLYLAGPEYSEWAYFLSIFPTAILTTIGMYQFYLSFFGSSIGFSRVLSVVYAGFMLFLVAEAIITDELFVSLTFLLPVFLISIPVVCLHVLYVVARAVREGREFAPGMAGGLLLIFAAVVHGTLVFSDFVSGELYIQEAFFVQCLIFAFILSRRFSLTFTRLETTEGELREINQNLERMVTDRTRTIQEQKEEIHQRNVVLEARTRELQEMMDHLVEVEKMAALGNLVTGMAHEINTPIGTSITAASMLQDELRELSVSIERGEMQTEELEDYLDVSRQSFRLIVDNLNRTANLVQNFKQLAVDQSSQDEREFNVAEYLDEILRGHGTLLKEEGIDVTRTGDPDVRIVSFPGPFARLFSNLIMNTTQHAYGNDETGSIEIDVAVVKHEPDTIEITYRDFGRGMDAETLRNAFQPFFTSGGTGKGPGLGLHIVYNIVHNSLGGRIVLESEPGNGVLYNIQLPVRGTSAKDGLPGRSASGTR